MNIETKRHSLAHVLAQAIIEIYGNDNVKLGFGPDIENGFYHDFEIKDAVVSDDDLKTIEKKMKNILAQNQIFEKYEMSMDDAMKKYKGIDEYRYQNLQKLESAGEEKVSFYKNIDQKGVEKFDNLCTGPHVEKLSQIDKNAFMLDKVAGAYWLGNEKNPMLTRVYGFAFDNRDGLDKHKKMLAEAKKRDHRIIGKKLSLFTISELIGPGLPLMQPAGMIIRQELEDYLWSLHKNKGYSKVWTPHIAKEALYEISGHADKFGDELFRVKGKDDEFIMKPMNCPHHMQLFADNQFSYRDMPIRYFEPATIYRDEKSGQLSGLTRVRAITQDDGHLFCSVGQIKQEVKVISNIIKEFYGVLGMIEDYWVSLSVRGDDKTKYLGSDDVWEKAEEALEEAASENELPYKRIEGEAAFYGPKLDFMFKDAIGREWQLATIQCDFYQPIRFDLSFTNSENQKERPVVIHRAIAGSFERCMGVLIEHFAGTFPLWLAPRQVIIIPVGEKFNDYAKKVDDELASAGIRVSGDYSSDGLNKKVRNAEKMHINYILVVGEQEESDGSVSVRNYKTKDQSVQSLEVFKEMVLSEVENKSL